MLGIWASHTPRAECATTHAGSPNCVCLSSVLTAHTHQPGRQANSSLVSFHFPPHPMVPSPVPAPPSPLILIGLFHIFSFFLITMTFLLWNILAELSSSPIHQHNVICTVCLPVSLPLFVALTLYPLTLSLCCAFDGVREGKGRIGGREDALGWDRKMDWMWKREGMRR